MSIIGKKLFSPLFLLFMFFGFSAKADGTPFCRVYLNDSLLKTIRFTEFGRTKIEIPHWGEMDTLKITYWQDTEWNENDQLIFRTQTDSLLGIRCNFYPQASQGMIKLSASCFPIAGCKVYKGYKNLPQYDFFVFELDLKRK